MGWVLSGFSLLLLSAATLAAITTALLWRERPRSGSMPLAIATAGIGIWSLAQTVVVSTPSPYLLLTGELATMGASIVLTAAWIVFALQYTGRSGYLTPKWVALALVVPMAGIVLAAATIPLGLEHVMVEDFSLSGTAGTASLTYELGPGTHLMAGYMWGLTLGGNWLLFRKFLASRNVYRRRSFLFLVIGTVVLFSTVSSAFNLDPFPHFTLTPLAFLALAPIILAVLLSFRTISFLPVDTVLQSMPGESKTLAPIARTTIMEEMSIGVVVLDHKNRIVDLNPAARNILGGTDQRFVGRDITEVVDADIFDTDDPAFLDPDVIDGEYPGVWVELEHGQRRCFDITITSTGLEGETDEGTGRVGLIADVTDRERRKQALEVRARELKRQNDQLEDFAHVVSHDLRNPVNVASGYLDLAEEEGKDEYFEQVRQAHTRMQNLIDDVLQMVRQGKTVEETESLELETVARAAWENVETEDAELEIVDSRTLQADRSRLTQLFENLFRNAVEHGGTDVSVRVGSVTEGFFVEDDGTGIPSGKRGKVFEKGVSGSDDGTGLGLAIVETVVDAHGWEVKVLEGTKGGARFEITGCRVSHDASQPDQFPISSGTD